jgi:hypothetical protein
MPTAIRIDKSEIIYSSKRHIDILFDYMNRENLSIDDADKMIEEGRIEFGAVFLNKNMTLDWSGDETRDSVYTDIDRMIEVGGRPQCLMKK